MRILLTNDDGIHAPGLQCLERIADRVGDEIWIVAPETDQSGFAHSLSLSEPLRLRKIGERRFAVRGTPTDCVIMGVKHVMPAAPDLILSGVNSGTNLADDVTYSGTVAGAMEGTMLGIRSIALSQAYHHGDGKERDLPWGTAEAHGPALIGKILAAELAAGVFININFPACDPDQVTGTVVTAQGKLAYGMFVEQRQDGRGLPYFWLRFGRETMEPLEGTDLHAISRRGISVTPLHLDLTAHETRAGLAKAIA